MEKLIIGTRGSLLARTQSNLIKEQLESLSGTPVELKKIVTQGDQITNVPLWQMDGKDFFTKELDQALLQGEVDLLVHSYKDLGSQRTPGIKLGAITERVFPEDVLLIKKSTIKNLNTIKTLKVGTSSPRRIALLEGSLSEFIPGRPKVETTFLRGNVNTRIKKLVDDEYHAICLAFAGMERLTLNEEALAEITNLVKDLNFMVLPPSAFPPAASQGALAIEFLENRQDNGKLEKLLGQLHHRPSAEAIKKERDAFESFGGGCHLPIGIHVKTWKGKHIHIHKGKLEDQPFYKMELENTNKPVSAKSFFIGLPPEKSFLKADHVIWDEYIIKKPIKAELDQNKNDLFVTSSYCLPTLDSNTHTGRIWAAGTRTSKLLAAKGFWVNGSSDGLGHGVLKNYESSKLLPLFNGAFSWQVLSHEKSNSILGETTHTYEHVLNNELDESYWKKILETEFFYWTSFTQFEYYIKKVPELLDKKYKHASGLGKTYDQISSKVNVTGIVSMNELKNLIAKGI